MGGEWFCLLALILISLEEEVFYVNRRVTTSPPFLAQYPSVLHAVLVGKHVDEFIRHPARPTHVSRHATPLRHWAERLNQILVCYSSLMDTLIGPERLVVFPCKEGGI